METMQNHRDCYININRRSKHVSLTHCAHSRPVSECCKFSGKILVWDLYSPDSSGAGESGLFPNQNGALESAT